MLNHDDKKPLARMAEALQRMQNWIRKAETSASAYVVLAALILYRSESGIFRVRPTSEITTLGLAQSFGCEHVALLNKLPSNEQGRRPDVPLAFIEKVLEADHVCLRGKHLVPRGDKHFDMMAKTFTSFKAGVGYLPSMFAAIHAGCLWHNIPYVVDFVRGAEGVPCGSDGGGLYISDADNPLALALRGEEAQGRAFSREKSIFAKGMWSPITRVEADRLYPHLKGLNYWIIIDPSQFKAGRAVELGDKHPLVAKGLDSSYKSWKDFFAAACAAGVNNLVGTISLGIMSIKKMGKTSLNAGAVLRLKKEAYPQAAAIMESNFSKWLRSGGVGGSIESLINQEAESGVQEMTNVVSAHRLMNEMMADHGNPMYFDAMGVKSVRDQVLGLVQRKFFRFYTGLGVRGKTLPARLDNTVPKGVVIVPSSTGCRHRQEALCWRQPLVATPGLKTLEFWVLDDPECPSEIREKYSYLIGSRAFVANELIITYLFQGDNDGDMMGFTTNPDVIAVYKEHTVSVFGKDEIFLIEGGKERGVRAKTPILESLAGLGLDYRGPIGPETRAQDAGLALGNEAVAAAFMRAMQTAVDQAKNEYFNPDYRQDADLSTWREVDIPGWPGEKAWSPSSAYLPPDMEEGDYPDVGKMMGWLKDQLGSSLADAMPWQTGRLSTAQIKAGPISEWSIVDMLYNRFLALLEESGVDLSASGEIVLGNHLLELIEWKSGKKFEVGPLNPNSRLYYRLLKDSGLQAFSSKKSQIMGAFTGGESEEVRERSMQLNCAKEALLSSLRNMSTEDRLTIWLTECKLAREKGLDGDGAAHLKKAYRVIFLGASEITALLGIEPVEGCTFMRDNANELLARVKQTMECPRELLNLHRFGGASAALLNGFEFELQDGEPVMRNEAETLNALHEEATGAPLMDCEVCVRRARYLLVNQYRWSPKESHGEYVVDLTKRINALLSEPAAQAAMKRELAPHYEKPAKD